MLATTHDCDSTTVRRPDRSAGTAQRRRACRLWQHRRGDRTRAVGDEAEVGALAVVVDDAEPTTPLRITIPAGETVYTGSSGEADLILAGMDKSSRYLAEIEEGDT